MLERLRSTVAPTTTTQEPASDAIDLRQVQDFFWRRWKLILSTTAVVAAVTYILLLVVTPRYTATAQVLLDPGNQKLLGSANLIPELSLDSGNVDSQLSLIRSTNLLRRVVEQTKLTQDPEFGALVQTRTVRPADLSGFRQGKRQNRKPHYRQAMRSLRMFCARSAICAATLRSPASSAPM